MAIIIYLHMSRYRNFKTYYTEYIQRYLRRKVPKSFNYMNRGELILIALWPLCPYLRSRLSPVTGIASILSQPLFNQLLLHDVYLIIGLCKNLRNPILPLFDKLMLRKRALIETITDQLKNISPAVHTSYRRVNNFLTR
jgi:hypothetical protein